MIEYSKEIDITKKFLEKKDVILFIGSGASIDANVAGWDTLKSILCNRLARTGIITDGLNIYQIMNQAKHSLGDEFYEILHDTFRNPLIEPGELDELISSLHSFFKFIVTPNYDKLLETAFRTIRTGIDPPLTTELDTAKKLNRSNEFFIYKFNGDIDDEKSIVLGTADYIDIDFDRVFDFFASCKIFYIGYGFRDEILEYVRKKAEKMNPSWKKHILIMMKEGPQSTLLKAEKYHVITFSNFEDQKYILREVCNSLIVDNPFQKIHEKICIPNHEISIHPLFSSIKDYVSAVSDRVLILHENWDLGWDANNFEYEMKGKHIPPKEAEKIIDKFAHQVKRPWWGKFAYTGIVYPLTERPGKIIGSETSYKKYYVIWKKMDENGILKATTIRERWWQHDVQERFEESNLPHILCIHMAVVSKDGKLLLTRKSENVAFEQKTWCPSLEEQTSWGLGEETSGSKPIDSSPMATCLRGLKEEIRIQEKWVDNITFHAFCTNWDYSDVSVIATVLLNVDSSTVSSTFGGEDVGEFQLDTKRWIQYNWTPARVDNISKLVKSLEYGEDPKLRGIWHVTAKLRLFSVMASMVKWKWATWENWNQQFQ
jgi:hypothetical protein